MFEFGIVGDQMMLGMVCIWCMVIFYCFMDIYGDIFYFEVGKGFIEGIDFFVFDIQEFIYKDMFKELEEGIV